MYVEKAPSQLQMAKEKYGASSKTKKDDGNLNIKVCMFKTTSFLLNYVILLAVQSSRGYQADEEEKTLTLAVITETQGKVSSHTKLMFSDYG